MITDLEKIRCDALAWVWTVVLVFTLMARFGKQTIEWILAKLHHVLTNNTTY